MRSELSDREWGVIKRILPNKPCGVPRVTNRRVPDGIFWGVAVPIGSSVEGSCRQLLK